LEYDITTCNIAFPIPYKIAESTSSGHRKRQDQQHRESAGDDFYKPSTPQSVMSRGQRDYEEKMAKYKDPKQRTGTDEEVHEMFKAFTSGDPAF